MPALTVSLSASDVFFQAPPAGALSFLGRAGRAVADVAFFLAAAPKPA